MFIDAYPSHHIRRFEFVTMPRWSTDIAQVANGTEQRNQNWQHPLRTFTAPGGISCAPDINALYHQWMVTRGPKSTFPMRDPFDFASRDLITADQSEPEITRTDQLIGTGDGVARSFQLIRRYTFGDQTYERPIHLPVTGKVLMAINGIDPLDIPEAQGGPNPWTVTRRGGVVTFDRPPPPAASIQSGFIFDVEVRFESDDAFEQVAKAYKANGSADLVFVEVRPC